MSLDPFPVRRKRNSGTHVKARTLGTWLGVSRFYQLFQVLKHVEDVLMFSPVRAGNVAGVFASNLYIPVQANKRVLVRGPWQGCFG